jgi:hypothetical protein
MEHGDSGRLRQGEETTVSYGRGGREGERETERGRKREIFIRKLHLLAHYLLSLNLFICWYATFIRAGFLVL